MNAPQWRKQGSEPDYRFSLANERTFLAWIRTAMGLLAGGVLLDQFSTKLGPHAVVVCLAVTLGLFASALGAMAYTRWRANEIAMRMSQPLPHSLAISLLCFGTFLAAGIIDVLLILKF